MGHAFLAHGARLYGYQISINLIPLSFASNFQEVTPYLLKKQISDYPIPCYTLYVKQYQEELWRYVDKQRIEKKNERLCSIRIVISVHAYRFWKRWNIRNLEAHQFYEHHTNERNRRKKTTKRCIVNWTKLSECLSFEIQFAVCTVTISVHITCTHHASHAAVLLSPYFDSICNVRYFVVHFSVILGCLSKFTKDENATIFNQPPFVIRYYSISSKKKLSLFFFVTVDVYLAMLRCIKSSAFRS